MLNALRHLWLVNSRERIKSLTIKCAQRLTASMVGEHHLGYQCFVAQCVLNALRHLWLVNIARVNCSSEKNRAQRLTASMVGEHLSLAIKV